VRGHIGILVDIGGKHRLLWSPLDCLLAQLLFVQCCAVTFSSKAPVAQRSIAISLSVCLPVCVSVGLRSYLWNRYTDLHEISCADPLWPWLSPNSVLAVVILSVRPSNRIRAGWVKCWPHFKLFVDQSSGNYGTVQLHGTRCSFQSVAPIIHAVRTIIRVVRMLCCTSVLCN